jgi:uncharacterized protein (DUF1810 family)
VSQDDPYDLKRFVHAQDADGTYQAALSELRAGRKSSHWMWFVFPQLAGLGRSQTARHFAISILDEARAYLRHPLLGPRLIECLGVLDQTTGHSAEQILGVIDAQKLHSSTTLFQRANPGDPLFQRVLDRYFAGRHDEATIQLLADSDPDQNREGAPVQ